MQKNLQVLRTRAQHSLAQIATNPHPNGKNLTVKLSKPWIEKLDEIATRLHVSKMALMRYAILCLIVDPPASAMDIMRVNRAILTELLNMLAEQDMLTFEASQAGATPESPHS